MIDQYMCRGCHVIGGDGGTLDPDLAGFECWTVIRGRLWRTPLELRELRPVEPDARLAERMAAFLAACAGQRAKAKTGERQLELATLARTQLYKE